MSNIFVAAVMPAKGRYHQTIECIRRMVATAGTQNYELVVVVDDDPPLALDLRMSIDKAWPVKLFTTSRRFGYWGALSMGAKTVTQATHLVNLANDLLPGVNWLAKMLTHVTSRTGHGGICAFNDGIHAGDHAAHFCAPLDLLRRWYGSDLVPLCYDHMYGDTEITTRARELGIFSAAPWAVLYHNHAYAGAALDDVYRLGHGKYAADKMQFEQRRANRWRD